ncbi:MAG: porin [Methylotenera sp.]|nr:porin [Methylotenera sp.]
MKTTIKLAVASALIAAASSANAGISIPAGDWTLDIGGNVNAYYSYNKAETRANSAATAGGALAGAENAAGEDAQTTITTGLLPSFLSVSGKTRQNDLDVGFTISIQPGIASANSLSTAGQENRQSFLTFGDKSWGTIKAGRDLGIFGSTAILSDITLLGVGAAGTNTTGTTTLGGIGSGYLYADWKAQISYASPNFNGFSFAVGVTQPWNATTAKAGSGFTAGAVNQSTSTPGFEGQATYEWAGDVAGKVWAGFITQKVEDLGTGAGVLNYGNETARGLDIGATVNVAGFALTGYYYDGKGLGTTGFLANAFDAKGNSRDSNGGYVQAAYTIPGVGTKLGVAYGISSLDQTRLDKTSGNNLVEDNERWTVGAYHPLTKHLNLVAEYNQISSSSHKAGVKDADNDNFSLGAILFF